MLRRLGLVPAVVLALVVAAGAVLVVGSSAVAKISCPNGQVQEIGGISVCVLTSNGPDTTVNGPPLQVEVTESTARERWCPANHAPPGFAGAPEGMVPCYDNGLGWFDRVDCYYGRPESLPADLNIESLEGYAEHGPDGLIYRRFCFVEHMGPAPGYFWQDSDYLILPEPPEFEGGTTPLVLISWEQAINELAMAGPEIGIIPLSGVGLVRLPVWMWDDGPSDHEADAQAPGGPLVEATATVQEIMWDPGDGSTPRGCDQGIPYESGMDIFATDCRHQYGRPSRNEPGGMFQIVATTTWHVQWWIDGVWNGELTLEAASAVDIQINELQVLTSR